MKCGNFPVIAKCKGCSHIINKRTCDSSRFPTLMWGANNHCELYDGKKAEEPKEEESVLPHCGRCHIDMDLRNDKKGWYCDQCGAVQKAEVEA